MPSIAETLQQCRAKIGKAPRKFSLLDKRKYLTAPKPDWYHEGDEIKYYFDGYSDTLATGELVWAVVIQANNHLWEEGCGDYPACIVYPIDHTGVTNEALREVGSRIIDLDGSQSTDPELQEIIRCISDYQSRPYHVAVPSAISPDFPCAISTIFLHRKHLPQGYLTDSAVPVLINPKAPHVPALLPSKYWPESLCKTWDNFHQNKQSALHKYHMSPQRKWRIAACLFVLGIALTWLPLNIASAYKIGMGWGAVLMAFFTMVGDITYGVGYRHVYKKFFLFKKRIYQIAICLADITDVEVDKDGDVYLHTDEQKYGFDMLAKPDAQRFHKEVERAAEQISS